MSRIFVSKLPKSDNLQVTIRGISKMHLVRLDQRVFCI